MPNNRDSAINSMRLEKEQCAAFIVDVQERLFPHMESKEQLEKGLVILIKGLKHLGVNLVVTQQYTKGLGNTIHSVATALESYAHIEKISFSCCDEPACENTLRQIDKKLIIVAGIEAHVCILQTVIDLIQRGIMPVLVEDCTASRREKDKRVAVERMRAAGAIVTTYESLLFELCRFAGNDTFRAISRLVK